MLASGLLLSAGASAYTVGAPGCVGRAAPRIAMAGWSDYNARPTDAESIVPNVPTWGDAREGEPFGKADRDDSGYRSLGGVRVAEESYMPRGISDANVIDGYQTYIETDDEPWHATCRPVAVVTKKDFGDAALPFIAAEEACEAAVRAAKDEKTVTSAIATALAAGARAGSPAIKACEKVAAAFKKGDDEAAEKAKPKAPKVQVNGKGWDDMARKVGAVHDNSVA
jgi:hypothetical protein